MLQEYDVFTLLLMFWSIFTAEVRTKTKKKIKLLVD